jgi:tetratricopeptide (TPR) repeat protein
MNYSKPAHHSAVYRNFRSIEGTEWQKIVRYYEENEGDIRRLDFEEYFELMVAYANALFETGAYQKHLLMADEVIEASVSNNIRFFNGSDIFHHTLFKKAASYYHVHELEKSDYILRELLRINPADEDAAMFLKKCLRQMNPAFLRQAKAIAMVLFLSSAFFICIELLVVRNFYPEYEDLMETTRNTLLLSGFVVLLSGEVWRRFRANREVNTFVQQLELRKKSKA